LLSVPEQRVGFARGDARLGTLEASFEEKEMLSTYDTAYARLQARSAGEARRQDD